MECGNLKRAIKVSNTEYNLLIEPDFNTKGHMHWFYFQVRTKLAKGSKLTLHLQNLLRADCLYSNGFQPVLYQEKFPERGFHRGKFTDFSYEQNPQPQHLLDQQQLLQKNQDDSSPLKKKRQKELAMQIQQLLQINRYTYSFSYELEEDNEVIEIASDVPYSYSRMIDFVKKQASNQNYNSFLRVNTLGYTMGKNEMKMMTITEDVQSYINFFDMQKFFQDKSQRSRNFIRQKLLKAVNKVIQRENPGSQPFTNKEQNQLISALNLDPLMARTQSDHEALYQESSIRHFHKKSLFITSRVHPGEPQGSWTLEGFLQFILSDEEEAKQLRKHFIVYVIPMMNPDGVAYGNHRCSLLGVDLNRKWSNPSPILQPEIFNVKNLVKMVREEREIAVFCDMHGHFRKREPFMYCCSTSNEQSIKYEARIKNAMLRVLPLMLSQKNHEFSFKDSYFRMEKYKESSARIVLFREFNILQSFTVESSFIKKVSYMQDIEEEEEGKEELVSSQANSQEPPPQDEQEIEEEKKELEENTQKEKKEEKHKQIEMFKDVHYNSEDHNKLGYDLGKTLARFVPNKTNQKRINFIIYKFMQILHSQLMAQVRRKNQNMYEKGNLKDSEQKEQDQVDKSTSRSPRKDSDELISRQESGISNQEIGANGLKLQLIAAESAEVKKEANAKLLEDESDAQNEKLSPNKKRRKTLKKGFSDIAEPESPDPKQKLPDEFLEIEQFMKKQAEIVKKSMEPAQTYPDEDNSSSDDDQQPIVIKKKKKKEQTQQPQKQQVPKRPSKMPQLQTMERQDNRKKQEASKTVSPSKKGKDQLKQAIEENIKAKTGTKKNKDKTRFKVGEQEHQEEKKGKKKKKEKQLQKEKTPKNLKKAEKKKMKQSVKEYELFQEDQIEHEVVSDLYENEDFLEREHSGTLMEELKNLQFGQDQVQHPYQDVLQWNLQEAGPDSQMSLNRVHNVPDKRKIGKSYQPLMGLNPQIEQYYQQKLLLQEQQSQELVLEQFDGVQDSRKQQQVTARKKMSPQKQKMESLLMIKRISPKGGADQSQKKLNQPQLILGQNTLVKGNSFETDQVHRVRQFDTRNQSNDQFNQTKFQQQVPQYFLKNPILENHQTNHSLIGASGLQPQPLSNHNQEMKSNRKVPLNKTDEKRKDRSPILSAKAQNQKLKFQKNSVYQVQKQNFQQIQQAIIRGQLADDMQQSVFASSCIPGLVAVDGQQETPVKKYPLIYYEGSQPQYPTSHQQQPSRNSISFQKQNWRKETYSQGKQHNTNYPHLNNNRIWQNMKDNTSAGGDDSEIKTINDHIKQTVMKSREGVTPQTFDTGVQNSNVKLRDFKRHIPGDNKSSQIFSENKEIVGQSQNFLKNFKVQQHLRGEEIDKIRKNSRSALSLEGLRTTNNQETQQEINRKMLDQEITNNVLDSLDQKQKLKPKIAVKVGPNQKEFLYKIQDDFSKKAASKRAHKTNIQFKVSTQNRQRIDELQQFIKRREQLKKDINQENSHDFTFDQEQ